MFSILSYKLDRSDNIYGWRGNRGHDPLPVRGYSKMYHQKRAADGENSLGVHTQRIPGKRSHAFFARVIARILSRPRLRIVAYIVDRFIMIIKIMICTTISRHDNMSRII